MNPIYRAWTPAEVTLLRQRYPKEGSVALARDLGRSKEAVRTKADSLGLRWRSYHAVNQARVVRLWRQGHSAQEIARELGCSTSGARRALERAGVAGPGCIPPDRPDCPRGCTSRLQRRALRENGYASLTQRRMEKQAYLSELSWPACGSLSPAQRRMLAALEAGSLTTGELASKLGLAYDRRNCTHGWQQTLWSLRDRGLVARQGWRIVAPHSRQAVWALAGLAAQAARRKREEGDLR